MKAGDLESAARAVLDAGGTITHDLGIINAVAAELTVDQLEALRERHGDLAFHENRTLTSAARGGKKVVSTTTTDSRLAEPTTESTYDTGTFKGYSEFPAIVGADLLHRKGVTGNGVTVAVLDTGLNAWPQITKNSAKRNRLLAHYDAIADQNLARSAYSDDSGHGTHVTSTVVDPSTDEIPAGCRLRGQPLGRFHAPPGRSWLT